MPAFAIRSLVVVVACLAASAVVLLPSPAQADLQCQHSPDSAITFFEGYGYRCAGHGPGCTQCVDRAGGGSCTTDGTSCEPFRRPVF